MNRLTIYILCHNRPDDACHAIRSVLTQTDHRYSLIISDNSSNDTVEQMVRQHFPDVDYVRRKPMLTALEHFNCCIEETASPYFCLFHDDDLMAPDFVKQILIAIAAHPEAVAIGCNARIETNGKTQPKPSFLSRHDHEVIASPGDMGARYFGRHQSGIAPFPGYVYRRDRLSMLKFRTDGGKYSDVTWLLDLAAIGQIVWIKKPLMTYRIHGGNDGLIESRRDRLQLLAYLKKHVKSLGQGLLADYRCGFIYKPILKASDTAHTRRIQVAQRFLRNHSWNRHIRIDTWRASVERALVKKAYRP